jgi:hypothetical protein
MVALRMAEKTRPIRCLAIYSYTVSAGCTLGETSPISTHGAANGKPS